MQQPRFICLLAEHTKFRFFQPRTYFSLGIRVMCCSRYSHYSVLYEDEQGELRVLESVWPKVESKPYAEWYAHADRLALPQFVDEAILPFDLEIALALEGKEYPVKDIPQQVLNIYRTRWMARGNNWNGRDGIGRSGIFCTELVGTGFRRADAHRLTPNDFYSPLGIRGLIDGKEFETFRNQAAMLPQFLQVA